MAYAADASAVRIPNDKTNCANTADIIWSHLVNVYDIQDDHHYNKKLKSESEILKKILIRNGDFFHNNSLNMLWLNFRKDEWLTHSFVYVVNGENVHIFESYIGKYYITEIIVKLDIFKENLLDVLLLRPDFHQSYFNLFNVEPNELLPYEHVGIGFLSVLFDV